MKKLKAGSLAAALLTFALAALPGTGAAQQPAPLAEPDSVPLALALAFSTTAAFAREPQILIGSMPGWVATKLSMPANAKVLGSSFLGTTAVAVVSVSASPADAIAEAKTNLLAHGWTNPPQQPTIPIGGFRQAPTTPAAGAATRATLCGDHEVLNAAARAERGGQTIVTYHLVTPTGYSACKLPDMSALTASIRIPSWPTLYNPAGATDAQSAIDCMESPVPAMGPATSVKSPISPDSLLRFYARQLADSGWKSEGAPGQLAANAWTRNDTSGATVETTITVRPSVRNPACRDVTMQVRTFSKP